MSYKENEVVAKYTKGNNLSDCGEYNVNDLLEMFDEAEITVDEYGNKHALTIKDGIVIDNPNYRFEGYRRIVHSAVRIS